MRSHNEIVQDVEAQEPEDIRKKLEAAGWACDR